MSDHGKWAKRLDPISVGAENQEAIAREWCEEEGLVWDDVLGTWMHPEQMSELEE